MVWLETPCFLSVQLNTLDTLAAKLYMNNVSTADDVSSETVDNAGPKLGMPCVTTAVAWA